MITMCIEIGDKLVPVTHEELADLYVELDAMFGDKDDLVNESVPDSEGDY